MSDLPESHDDRTPEQSGFLVVGLGASAGGVEALQQFFAHISPDSGLAYVVILHLSPGHDSQLASILQTVAAIPVTQVTARVRVEPNHIYVIPPNQHLLMIDGQVAVVPTTQMEERRAPIDLFFRTLAETHQARAVCVVLSGTGTDGSMGLKRVKERGGAVFVQNPDEAAFDEMPRNAIATDLVDEVLPVAAIPTRILTYGSSLGSIAIPAEPEQRSDDQQQALRDILGQLRVRTGHDFSNYKRPTLLRRIERRIIVRNLPGLPAYAAFLREHADEAPALLKDLLISVTNFFRDQEAFAALEQETLPRLFHGKRAGEQVRIWVVGCATGEEAYSIAMLCAERVLDTLDAPSVQIFATDIDEAALARARAGVYTPTDIADISPERLRRFFTPEEGRYRVRRELREMILFAQHNVLKDPPFAHLDLATCRNLLIYLNGSAQERVLETLHFALHPGGYLFLGSAESIDIASDLYATTSREQRIFQSRPTHTRPFPIPEAVPLPYVEPPRLALPTSEPDERARERISYGDLHHRLLEQYAPPSVVINQDYEIVHLVGRASRYFEMPTGNLTSNLLELIRPELRVELRSALYQAVQQQTNVDATELPISIDGHTETVTIHVRPVLRDGDPARGFVLVLFAQGREGGNATDVVVRSDEAATRHLEAEVERLRLRLRTSSEQYEVQTEELKASNEELHALNEELRSSNEELETSKEELQSLNEELRTVNQELKVKVEEATQSNTNLQNLVNATDIATIFLDTSSRIRLFTPAARTLFNIIPADYGRPLSHITHRLRDADVIGEAEQVFATLQAVEHEVRTTDDRVFLMRVLPYRIGDDRIGGVVLTFVDITARQRAEAASRESQQRLRLALDAANMGTFVYHITEDRGEPDARMLALFGLPEDGTLNLAEALTHLIHPDDRGRYAEEVARATDPLGDGLLQSDIRVRQPDGSLRWVAVTAQVLFEEQPRRATRMYGVAADITERKQAEERQAFLLKLSDALRPVASPVAIEAAVTRLALEYFAADRCYYCTIEDGNAIARKDAVRGDLPSVAGIYPLQDFAIFRSAINAGKPYAVPNVHTTDTLDEGLRQICLQLGIVSTIIVPVIKQGAAVGLFCLVQSAPREWTAMETDLAAEIAERTWAAVERARAEAALARSEAKYRTLFDSIDEGVSTLEIIFDANDKAVDYRFVEQNPALTKLTGLTNDIIGKTVNEVVPNLESDWFERFEQVVKTGKSTRFELPVIGLGGWYDIYVSRVGGEGSRTVVTVYNNITERKRREANQEFLSAISEDLSRLSNEEEIIRNVGAKLAAHLQLTCYHYVDVNEERAEITIRHFWHAMDVPSILGTYPIPGFMPPNGLDILRSGKSAVINDVQNDVPGDTAATAALKAGAAAQKISAYIAVPSSQDGRWKAYFAIADTSPRRWTRLEIELIQEVSSRMFPRIERVRAEEALRVSEEKYRTLFDSIDEGFTIVEVLFDANETPVDYRFLEINRAFERHMGIEDAAGRLMRKIEPRHEAHWFETYGRIALTGEPARFEAHAEYLNQRWFDVYAFRVEAPELRHVAILFTDITARKEAEAERERLLREAEAARVAADLERRRLLAVLEQLPVGVHVAEAPSGRLVFDNAAVRDICGEAPFSTNVDDYSRDYAGYYPAGHSRAGEPLASHAWPLACALVTGQPVADELVEIRRADGTRRLASISAVAVRDADDRVVGAVATSVDVTEMKRAEEALRESDARFRTLTDAVPQVIWANDADGRANYFNERWYEYSGLSYEQSAGPGWQAIVHPDDAPASRERWQQALAAGDVFDTEYRLRRADGAYRWHLGRNVPLRDEHGQITGWFGSATDIEELKQAEAAVRESEERFRLLIEGARDYAMFLLDPENRITFWSTGAERLFGWSEAEAIGQSGGIIFTPEDREHGAVERELHTALTDGRAEDRRWHVRKDGSRLFLDGVQIRLDDETGELRGFVKIGRDVSALRNAEEALQRAHDALEERVQERTSELAAANTWLQQEIVERRKLAEQRALLVERIITAQEAERQRIAHELHDTLGQFLSALGLRLSMAQSLEGMLPAVGDELAQLRALTKRVDQEVDRLTMELRPPALEHLGLADALRSYAAEWTALSGVAVDVLITGLDTSRMPSVIETTAYRIVQEALTNVLKHAQAKAVSVIVERRVGELRVIVEDDGVGFEPIRDSAQGSGGRQVGLIGMAERATLAGGELTIESEVGAGTTIYLQIPLSDDVPKDTGDARG